MGGWCRGKRGARAALEAGEGGSHAHFNRPCPAPATAIPLGLARTPPAISTGQARGASSSPGCAGRRRMAHGGGSGGHGNGAGGADGGWREARGRRGGAGGRVKAARCSQACRRRPPPRPAPETKPPPPSASLARLPSLSCSLARRRFSTPARHLGPPHTCPAPPPPTHTHRSTCGRPDRHSDLHRHAGLRFRRADTAAPVSPCSRLRRRRRRVPARRVAAVAADDYDGAGAVCPPRGLRRAFSTPSESLFSAARASLSSGLSESPSPPHPSRSSAAC